MNCKGFLFSNNLMFNSCLVVVESGLRAQTYFSRALRVELGVIQLLRGIMRVNLGLRAELELDK